MRHFFTACLFTILFLGFSVKTNAFNYPSGGEVLNGGSGYKIKFHAEGYNNFWYSIDSGATWNYIGRQTYYSIWNESSYFWVTPAVNSNNCFLRMATDNVTNYYQSSRFSIQYNGSVRLNLTSFNEGEKVAAGSSKEIIWESTGASSFVSILYSSDAGTTWETVTAKTPNTGKYLWSIPVNPSTNAIIKVVDFKNKSIVSQSKKVFMIQARPLIFVSTPKTAEALDAGTSYAINWKAYNLSSDFVDIEFSADSGKSWQVVASNEANDGTYSWNVINKSTNKGFIRIRDRKISSAFQLSGMFNVLSRFLKIDYPDYGVSLTGCTTQKITWTSSGKANTRVNLYFSTDNGITWISLASNITSVFGRNNYSWTPPGFRASQCKVKVVDATSTEFSDESDLPFSINYDNSRTLTITSPNGGESIKSGNVQSVTWTQTGSNSSAVKLKYSTNQGSTWSDISTYASNNGTYSWTVPEIASSKFLVRVEDYNTSCIYDQSNAPFTVTAPGAITVYSSGDTLFPGTQRTLGWFGKNIKSEYVNIEFSSNGTTWNLVAGKELNDGNYTWTIPNVVSNNCFIRISDFSDATLVGTGAKFSIKQAPVIVPSISVVYPQTYVAVYAYKNQTDKIKWTSANLTSGYVNIELSKDNATSWETVATHVPNNGEYVWNIPYIETQQAYIRISEYGNPSVRDSSDYYFRIEKPSIKINYPNGGEVLSGCAMTYLQYNSKGGNERNYYLSKDNGNTWEPIDAGTYGTEWNTQYINCSKCKIRIVDKKDPSVEDISDAPFSVTCTEKRNKIQITKPSGGEVLTNNDVSKVTWTSTGELRYDAVDLLMSVDGGLTWNWAFYYDAASYSGDIDDKGTYDWRPQIVADKVLLRLQEWLSTDGTYYQTKVPFSVKGKPSINVLSPSESERIMAGASKLITWETDYLDTNLVSLAYSKNGGASWNIIAANEINDGEYLWTVPEDTSSSYVLKVYDAKTPTTFGTKSFKVQKPINIVVPAGGEVIDKCSNFAIKWKSTYSGYADILYSSDNGSTWKTLYSYFNTKIGDNSYTASFSTVTDKLILKIRNPYDTIANDLSLSVKVAENPYASLKLLYPNGLQELKGGIQDTIRWETKGDIPYVTLQYSTNQGVTWNTLDYGNTLNTGKYKWDVPNSNYPNVQVKVLYSQNTCINDQNDTTVSIKGRPTITLFSPNGGNIVYTGSINTISWTNENASGGLLKIEYSSDSGSTWKLIEDNVMNWGDYYWKVNSAPSTKYLIRITDKSDNSVSDVSNQVFTVKGPSINISTPTASDTLYGCSAVNISWIAEGASGAYEIGYSVNNGTTWVSISEKVTGTSYSWNVPTGLAAGQVIIRVRDAGNPVLQALTGPVKVSSEKLFVRLKNPSAGEVLKSGSKKPITWESSKHISYVNLYYSIDSGVSWNNILYYSGNTNSFEWTVPNVASSLCILKLKDFNSCAADSSALPFTIQKVPYFTINFPNSGSVVAGTSNTISWSSSNYTGTTVNIDWSKDAGKTWTNGANQVANSGIYTWTLPMVESDSFYLRVSDPLNPLVSDMSDNPLKIAKRFLNVKSPVTGDTLVGCQSALIKWENFGGTGTYMIDFSSDNGKTWKNITSSTYGSPYGWTVPTLQSNDCFIRVSNPTDTSFKAISAKFAVKYNTTYVKVLSPNGGEVFDTGKDINIQWKSANTTAKVKFDYSTNGTAWYYYDQIPNTGKYTWYYTGAAENLWVRISDLNYSCNSDASDKPFSVKSAPYLRILKPVKKDTIYIGQKYDLSWYSSYNSTTKVQIQYSANGGTTWNLVALVSNTGYYSWTAPELAPGSYLIKITSESDPAILDQTEITIQKPTLEIIAPKENEVLSGCTSKKIEWKGKGLSYSISISYSSDNGTTWNTITSSTTNTGFYNWTVPGINSNQCLVKITDVNSPNISIVSPKKFSIQANKVFQFAYPAGGEIVRPGSTMEIKWSYSAFINNVDLAYSANAGVSWITIGTFLNTGSYLWTVPATVSSNYMIRIVDNSTACRLQTSNLFTVATQEIQNPVWPGDANNDGVANVYDLLSLGLSYGTTGTMRATITNAWSGQQAADWQQVQVNGKNMKYADCNGDGVVNYSDTIAISQNYGFTHAVSSGASTLGLNPDLYFVVSQIPVAGNIFKAELWAGSSAFPVSDFYGIAFKIGYDGAAVEVGSARLGFSDSWVGVVGRNALAVQKGDQNSVIIDGAIVRNNKTVLSGYGKIADIEIKLKNNATTSSGLLKVLEYKAVNLSGNALLFDVKDQPFEVGVVTGNKDAEQLNCKIYPNPNAGQFYLESTIVGEAHISITDMIGTTVFETQYNLSGTRQELKPGLLPGMYLVKIESGQNRFIRPLIIE